MNTHLKYYIAVGSGTCDDSSDESDTLRGTGYILGSVEYNTVSFDASFDSDSSSLTFNLGFDDSGLNKNIEFSSITETEAEALFDAYSIDWGSYSCMVPYSARAETSGSDSDSDEETSSNMNEVLSGIWLTATIDDETSPFDGWTDLELFSTDLSSDSDSCWAYYDQNGDWRIGGPFTDFVAINGEGGYYDELRLFLWEDIAVDETDSCRFGSEVQVRIDEKVMLFTFLCSDQFVGGTSLIYKEETGRFDHLVCPILTV